MNEEIYDIEHIKKFNSDGGEILLFCIENLVYGIEIQYITEIIGIQPVTVIPKVADFIKGVINIRGKVVPVISARKKMRRPEISYDDRTCIIVVDIDEITVGIIVDRVRAVEQVSTESICSTVDYKKIKINQYVQNIVDSDGEIKQILNIRKFVME